jgi:hypothetical protein
MLRGETAHPEQDKQRQIAINSGDIPIVIRPAPGATQL